MKIDFAPGLHVAPGQVANVSAYYRWTGRWLVNSRSQANLAEPHSEGGGRLRGMRTRSRGQG
jgi:hypothetical protein